MLTRSTTARAAVHEDLPDCASVAHDRRMPLHLRWHPTPILAPLAVLATLPALLIWAAAVVQSVGVGHPLDALPVPAAAATRPDRLLLLGTFLAVTLGDPLAAFLLGVLAVVDAEIHVEHWEITARLRPPAPPWRWLQLLTLLLLALGAVLFLAMAGHLAADCLLGGDCASA
jgi:hypothetical protein